jgi:hypothetical protein
MRVAYSGERGALFSAAAARSDIPDETFISAPATTTLTYQRTS